MNNAVNITLTNPAGTDAIELKIEDRAIIVRETDTVVIDAIGSSVAGPTGPQGSSGVVSVSAPITNGGTSSAATIGINVGTTAGTVAAGNDSRFTNARTPTAHASTHNAGGSDPITSAAFTGKPFISLSAAKYGIVVGSSTTDNYAGINQWLSDCYTTGLDGKFDITGKVYFGSTGGQLNAETFSNLTIHGPGKSRSFASCLFYNGTWAGMTTIADGTTTDLADRPSTIPLTDGSKVIPAGTSGIVPKAQVVVETANGNVTVNYTGVSGNNLTGCTYDVTPISGSTLATGARVWNPAVNMRRAAAIKWDDLSVTYATNTSFSGFLMDLSGGGGPAGSSCVALHSISGAFGAGSWLTGTGTPTLFNTNCSYGIEFHHYDMAGAKYLIEEISSSSPATPFQATSNNGGNWANGTKCMGAGSYMTACSGYSIRNPGHGFVLDHSIGEPNQSGVANMVIVDDAFTSFSGTLTINGGWWGDSSSGSWITWEGGNLSIIGLYATLGGASLVKLSGTTTSLLVSGGAIYSTATNGAVNLNGQSVATASIGEGVGWTGTTTPVNGTSGLGSGHIDTGSGTFAVTGGVTASTFSVPSSGTVNLLDAQSAYPFSAANRWAAISSGTFTTVTFDSSIAYLTPSIGTAGSIKLVPTSTTSTGDVYGISLAPLIGRANIAGNITDNTITLASGTTPPTPASSSSPLNALIGIGGGGSTTMTATNDTSGTYTGPAPLVGAYVTSGVASGTPKILTASSGSYTVTGGTTTGSGTSITVGAYADTTIATVSYTGVSGSNLTGCNLVSNQASSTSFIAGAPIMFGAVPASRGSSYTTIFSVKPASTNVMPTIFSSQVSYLDACGNQIGSSVGSSGTLCPNGSWTQVAFTGTSASTTVAMSPRMRELSPLANGSQTIGNGSTLNVQAAVVGRPDLSAWPTSGSFVFLDTTTPTAVKHTATYTGKASSTQLTGVTIDGSPTATAIIGTSYSLQPPQASQWNFGGMQIASGSATGWVPPGVNNAIGLSASGMNLGGFTAVNAGAASNPSDVPQYGQLQAETARATTAESLLAPLASPALTGSPTAPTQTAGNNSTAIATTAYTDAAVSTETTRATTAEALLAPKASPALTGTPTAPTAGSLTSNTQIATTAYADGAVASEATARANADNLLAPLASPALTGSPTAPTKTAGDNSTKIATTAYVDTADALNFPKIPYISGQYYPARTNYALTTQVVLGTPYAYPFVVTKSASFSKISMTTGTTAGSYTGTGYMVYQVCADDGTGKPGSLVSGSQCSATLASGAGSGVTPIGTFSSSISLTPGLYWLIFVFQCSGTVTTAPSIRTDTIMQPLSPFGSTAPGGGTFYGSYSYTTSVTYSGAVVYPSAPPAGTATLVSVTSTFIVGLQST